jgi:hypothetical protein
MMQVAVERVRVERRTAGDQVEDRPAIAPLGTAKSVLWLLPCPGNGGLPDIYIVRNAALIQCLLPC